MGREHERERRPRGGKEHTVLTDDSFHAWCLQNKIPAETEAYIERIRSSQPVRKVRSRASNVSGRYPSVKMGRSIQFESRHVELWGIYEMERDDDVLEYYDQPTRIQLQYRARSGRKTTQWHTPDFFVIRQHSAGFEEWKPVTALDTLTVTMPERYQSETSGGWRCPPGESAAQVHGLFYRVRTNAEVHPLVIQNLKFLQDFWIHPYEVPPEQEAQVLTLVSTAPGITVRQLQEACPDPPVDVLWALLTDQRLFTDLSASSLMQWDQIRLFRSQAEAEEARSRAVRFSQPIPLFTRLSFDGRLWEAEKQGDQVVLRPEVGVAVTLPTTQVQHLLATGAATLVGEATPSKLSEEARTLLLGAGPTALAAANQRLSTILAYMSGETVTVTKRSVQNWLRNYHEAERTYGCGYLGLLDKSARRGNRAPRVDAASKQLLETVLRTHYAVPQAKRRPAVYALYREECVKQHVSPVSQATFYRECALFTTPEVTTARRGKRAAYADQPRFFYLDQTTARHGERPFALAHLDHTELDILLVSSITGKPLARPYATFLIDAYSRRLLAVHVSYEPPSYRSVMMAFRLCVQRYGRLPQEIVVDHGPEFGSVYFEALLSQCFVTKINRPPQQPHFGSVIERIFGTTTSEFLNQLRGNTQASKVPRLLTREVDPKRLAVWTLERFAARLTEYVYEVYDVMEHPALFMSPREAYAQGMELAGARSHRVIAYSEAFLMQTRPTTRTGKAKIYRGRGITVNGLQYWHERMMASDIAGQTVPVRFEPYDMGVVYAYIDGQWLGCIADAYAQVHGRSEKEWNLILDEWREHQRQHAQKRVTLNGPLLAQFLQQVEQEETFSLQHEREYEEQALRSASLGSHSRLPRSDEIPPEITIDLTKLRHLEEYR
jgi:putative transposase